MLKNYLKLAPRPNPFHCAGELVTRPPFPCLYVYERYRINYFSVRTELVRTAFFYCGLYNKDVITCGWHVLMFCVRVVKMSSPNLNNVILLGSVVMILTVFFYEQSSKYTRSFCSVGAVRGQPFLSLFSRWCRKRLFLQHLLKN